MRDLIYIVSLLLCVLISMGSVWIVYDLSKSLREYRELTARLTAALNQSSEALSNTTKMALEMAKEAPMTDTKHKPDRRIN